jgi:hypothetical protein
MKKGILWLVALAFALAVVAPAFAEDAPQEKPAAKPALRTEIIRLKYFSNGQMQSLVRSYLSREGQYTPGPDNRIMVVSDYPENVERLLQAIRQIDVKPADIQLTVQLILGSEEEEKGTEPLPNDPVMKELRNLLKYKSYSLLDTSMVRATDNINTEVRMGEKADFAFEVLPKVIRDEKTSLISIQVRLRRIQVVFPAGAPKADYVTTDLIDTTLSVKPGDKTVVGVSKLDGGGKGLILIISGKIVE